MVAHSHDLGRESTERLGFRVEGMDCSSCVGKIEKALTRLPGVSEIELNFATQVLELRLSANGGASAADVEETIEGLGFGVSALPGQAEIPVNTPRLRWWAMKKGRLVIGLGALMGAAYLLAWLFPVQGSVLFTVAVVLGVFPFARQALALARAGSPFSIEMLMSVAALGALFIGEGEEAAVVVFLFAVGELLEGVAADRARAGIRALTALMPTTAIRLDAQGHAHTVPVSDLRPGDRVRVRPGDRVSADGRILVGDSSLDESPVTGESIPRTKGPGDAVFAGAINVDGVLELEVEKAAADNTIARIIRLVEQAQAAKSPTARFIETFSRYYTPAVMAIAAMIIVVPPLLLGAAWETWLYRGLALLLIACPCALVLSTPAAIASGLAVATRRGLLVKGGNALETIGRVRTIAFDKTGTLTEGRPRVTEIVALADGGENEVLTLAAAIEAGSNHPLAKAIVAHAEQAGLSLPAATESRALAGKAVQAEINGRQWVIASPTYAAHQVALAEGLRTRISALQQEGKTVSVLFDATGRQVLGLIALRDEARPDARNGIAQLKALGIRPLLLSGDNARTAQAIAAQLGMEGEAELLPEDKLTLINTLKQAGKVAMVGDGINDAPALAAADVGIAMGGGTDVALETADAALLKSRVTDVAHLVALSRATLATIHQNVVLALGLKGVFLLTTVLGVTGLWMAVLADTGATALVTLNALRLLRYKPRDASASVAPSSPAENPAAL